MMHLKQTAVTERHAQFSESDMDVSALLPRDRNMFAGHFAETAQLDKQQRMPSEFLNVLYGDVATLTSILVDDVMDIREDRQTRVIVNVTTDTRYHTFDAADKANSDRVELLARKYAVKEGLSKEDAARFAIVTERIRQLLPTVSAEDFENLEQVLETVREIKSADIAAREKLGLPHKKN